MAKNDIRVISGDGGVVTHAVDDRDTSSANGTLKRGEPVKVSTNFALLVATGDPEVGTDELLGVCATESTETASADGVVDVYQILPMQTILEGKATTATNMDTAAELLGLRNDWVTFDVDGSDNVTIDEDEGSDPNVHGLQIVDGDTVAGTLRVRVHTGATSAGPLTGQTMD